MILTRNNIQSSSCEFTKEQLEEISKILVTIPPYKMSKNTTVYDDINLNRYHYLTQKFATLNRIDSEDKIKNRFAYFIKMLKQDTEIT